MRSRATAARLAREALEQLGIRFTFGIPGVHNTELYDELGASDSITPVLVAHECGGAFMADAVSRTGAGVGVLAIVPAAGVTHAASGIGEAFLDGIPMLVIAGGVRRDLGRAYQLHDMDQQALVAPITKARWRVERHADVMPVLYEAYRIATTGEPGPVFVEIPVDLQLMPGDAGECPEFTPPLAPGHRAGREEVARAAAILRAAKHPAIFCGWGAVDATAELIAIAELLGAPVSTTLQGLSAFPGNHRLHAGFALGPAAVPAVANAFRDCDALLAVGTRFAEIPTGSYGWSPPASLVHVDINPRVFNANHAAAVALEGDARAVLALLRDTLGAAPESARAAAVSAAIAKDKRASREAWLAHDPKGRVNPQRFFSALRARLPDDGIVVADDGNHTFLVAELMPIHAPRAYFSPSDFNSMGYCIPAVIGAKLARPERVVVGIVGDGAARMTGLEMATAVAQGIGVAWFVFNDGELAQIAQAQETPYNRKTCTVLPELDFEGLARANGVGFLAMQGDADVERVIGEAFDAAARGKPVLVDVRIDYSRRTRFTEGVIRTNLKRFGLADQARLVGRALWRRLSG
ncbi:MAG TPA: thiamine pyrophosphate-binding protein [Steroidobacteraceae bacterium]|nr:thiamine pyrophosphate-binding protein [Steroidobacteraceae bacterium]